MKSSYSSGLGEPAQIISVSAIRKWVQTLKEQENGRNPDVHKINGNMAWYERSGNTDRPIYQLYKHFGKSSSKLLNYVKSAVPEEFGLKQTPPEFPTTPIPAGGGSSRSGGIGSRVLLLGGAVAVLGFMIYRSKQ
jgi:hypothetical protein